MNADARASSAAYGYFLAQSDRQDLTHPDMADPRVLNQVIWFSVRGPASPMPAVARLPVFDAMQAGIERAGRAGARAVGPALSRPGSRAGGAQHAVPLRFGVSPAPF